MREIRRCPAQSVMDTVTASLEKQVTQSWLPGHTYRNLKAHRGTADLRATLYCRGELIKALGRSVEMRTECVLSSGFVDAAGSSSAEFST